MRGAARTFARAAAPTARCKSGEGRVAARGTTVSRSGVTGRWPIVATVRADPAARGSRVASVGGGAHGRRATPRLRDPGKACVQVPARDLPADGDPWELATERADGAIELRTNVRPIGAWAEWPGTWGDTNGLMAGSPRGPVGHTQFTDPLGWVHAGERADV